MSVCPGATAQDWGNCLWLLRTPEVEWMRTRHCCGYLGDLPFVLHSKINIGADWLPSRVKKKKKNGRVTNEAEILEHGEVVRNMGVIRSENAGSEKWKHSENFHFYKRKFSKVFFIWLESICLGRWQGYHSSRITWRHILYRSLCERSDAHSMESTRQNISKTMTSTKPRGKKIIKCMTNYIHY